MSYWDNHWNPFSVMVIVSSRPQVYCHYLHELSFLCLHKELLYLQEDKVCKDAILKGSVAFFCFVQCSLFQQPMAMSLFKMACQLSGWESPCSSGFQPSS